MCPILLKIFCFWSLNTWKFEMIQCPLEYTFLLCFSVTLQDYRWLTKVIPSDFGGFLLFSEHSRAIWVLVDFTWKDTIKKRALLIDPKTMSLIYDQFSHFIVIKSSFSTLHHPQLTFFLARISEWPRFQCHTLCIIRQRGFCSLNWHLIRLGWATCLLIRFLILSEVSKASQLVYRDEVNFY